MSRKVLILRWLLTGLLLAGLCFGAAGQSLMKVGASPGYQACINPFAEWTFDDGTINPTIPGTGTMVIGSGVSVPTFVDRAGSNGKAVSLSGWDPILNLNGNHYVEFQVDTTKRYNVQFSFDSYSSKSGPFLFVLSYSTDGGAHFVSTNPQAIGPRWYTQTFNFKVLNNNPNVRIRLYPYFTDSTGGDFWYLDNVIFTGGCSEYIATPTNTPTATLPPPTSVIINEVAWMGTSSATTSYEYIELYNPTTNSVNLTDWEVKALDGSPIITILDGTIIPAGGYILLESNDNAVRDVPSKTKDWNGSLSNSGEVLELLNNTGNAVDTANANGGAWPAGSSSWSCGYGSMERIDPISADSNSNWVTNTADYTWTQHDNNSNLIHGTPGGRNWIFTYADPVETTPTPTPASPRSVVISEVAWAGTAASPYDEWIELQNPTTADINLHGWSLRADDGTPTIALDGTILKTSFYLTEHRDDLTVKDVFADLIYESGCTSQSLSDSGEILRLYDPNNNVIDTANANGGSWPAGSSSTKGSMERRGPTYGDVYTSWITNTGVVRNGHDRNWDGITPGVNLIKGTPKKPNWAFQVTPTPLVSATPTRTSTPVPQPAPILVINEFLPRPGHDWNNDGKVDVYDEFIEVINAGTIDVNTGGYKLDDEQNLGSAPFTLPSKTLKPGEIAVFFGSQTGILLEDNGDTVRLLNSSNKVVDAFTYPIAKSLDVSWCRWRDGFASWLDRCFPTPGLPNSLIGDTFPPAPSGGSEAVCELPDTTPEEFLQAECQESGLGIWNPSYWDNAPGEGIDIWISDQRDKGLVIYQ